MKRTRLWSGLAVLALLVFAGVIGYAQEDGSKADEALDSLCADCHEDQTRAMAHNPHSVLTEPGWGKVDGGPCTSCHSGAENHIEQGGGLGTIFAFSEDESAAQRTDGCLACHASVHPRFPNSPHAAAGVSCTDCHQVHSTGAGLLKAQNAEGWDPDRLGPESATCAQCHQDVLANFQFNERHRLQEGILKCTNCHNPHEQAPRIALGGFKQETCINCHTDKGGPFVFEHPSVKVEGCTACHTPHGSPNRHLLNFQRVAEVCFSCHAVVPGFHSRFTLDTVCTNCHSSIHGSNFHPAFLK